MNHDKEKKGPSLEQRTQSLQDSIAALTERLKTQNRSLSELRKKVKDVESDFGKVSARAGGLKASVFPVKRTSAPALKPAAVVSKPASAPAPVPTPLAVKRAPTPAPMAIKPVPVPDTGFLKPALALMLLSAVAFGSVDIQDTLTKGMEGIRLLKISGTRPAAREMPVRRVSPSQAKRRRAPAPEKTTRLTYLPRKLPAIPRPNGEAEKDQGEREALRMVYSFRPSGWQANVLDVLGNIGPEPLKAEPVVERLDRDIYQVTFTTPRQGRSDQTFSFEADVVGGTVFVHPDTAQKLAYHPSSP